MKKVLTGIMVGALAAAVLCGCGANKAQTTDYDNGCLSLSYDAKAWRVASDTEGYGGMHMIYMLGLDGTSDISIYYAEDLGIEDIDKYIEEKKEEDKTRGYELKNEKKKNHIGESAVSFEYNAGDDLFKRYYYMDTRKSDVLMVEVLTEDAIDCKKIEKSLKVYGEIESNYDNDEEAVEKDAEK